MIAKALDIDKFPSKFCEIGVYHLQMNRGLRESVYQSKVMELLNGRLWLIGPIIIALRTTKLSLTYIGTLP
jgi:hypothetical protein